MDKTIKWNVISFGPSVHALLDRENQQRGNRITMICDRDEADNVAELLNKQADEQ